MAQSLKFVPVKVICYRSGELNGCDWRWVTFSSLVLLVTNQDEKLTVTQAAPGSGNPSSIRFQYQISERRSAYWDTALSEDSLFLEIPAGPLVEGSKDG